MGNQPQQPKQKPVDMMDALINMKMKSKQFARESTKADKEKLQNIAKAKDSLKKGNEEGARLFLELADQKKNESMNYLKMSARLEHLAANIKSKNASMQMVGELDRFSPLLQFQAENMPIEEMYRKLNDFGVAYDNLTVKGKMMDENIDNVLGEKGSTQKVDQMMKELQAEVQMDMGMVPTLQVTEKDTQKQAQPQQHNKNDDFFEQLKNL